MFKVETIFKRNLLVDYFTNKYSKPLSSYCDEWLQNKKFSLKESSMVKYETILRCHIKPYLGMMDPYKLTSVTIDNYINDLMTQKKLSPKTVKDILIVLNSVLNYTSKQNFGKNINIDITYPKCSKKQMKVLSQEEQRNLIDYLVANLDSCTFGILLAMFTGLRIGELCALKWHDISIESRTLCICSTMQRLHQSDYKDAKTKVVITSPKSETSQRIIPIPDSIYNICKKMSLNDSEAFVLTGSRAYMEPRTLQYRLKKYTQECGLEDVHFHALRHTFATRCVEVGFEVKSLSEILGHATTTLTLDRYVHSSMDLKRINMKKLEAIEL